MRYTDVAKDIMKAAWPDGNDTPLASGMSWCTPLNISKGLGTFKMCLIKNTANQF